MLLLLYWSNISSTWRKLRSHELAGIFTSRSLWSTNYFKTTTVGLFKKVVFRYDVNTNIYFFQAIIIRIYSTKQIFLASNNKTTSAVTSVVRMVHQSRGGDRSIVVMVVTVSVSTVGSTGVIVATAVVHVGEEASVRVSVILDSAHVTAWLLDRVLAGHVFACEQSMMEMMSLHKYFLRRSCYWWVLLCVICSYSRRTAWKDFYFIFP